MRNTDISLRLKTAEEIRRELDFIQSMSKPTRPRRRKLRLTAEQAVDLGLFLAGIIIGAILAWHVV